MYESGITHNMDFLNSYTCIINIQHCLFVICLYTVMTLDIHMALPNSELGQFIQAGVSSTCTVMTGKNPQHTQSNAMCIFSNADTNVTIFRSTGPIAVARRRSVGRSVCLSVRPSTPLTRQPMFGFFSKLVGIFLG